MALIGTNIACPCGNHLYSLGYRIEARTKYSLTPNMVSPQLVEQWRVRLAEWQQRLVEGRPRPWLANAYVRVLSFLLKQYTADDVAAPSPAAADTLTPDRQAMTLIVAADDVSGKPPRGGGDIRSVLEAVKANSPQAESGPLAAGLPADDPIVVASFYHPGLAASLEHDLLAAGIDARRQRFRRQTQVVVRAGDLEHARRVVGAQAKFGRDSIRFRRQYASLFSTIGGGLGVVLGLLAAAFAGYMAGGGSVYVLTALGVASVAVPVLSVIGFVAGTIVDG